MSFERLNLTVDAFQVLFVISPAAKRQNADNQKIGEKQKFIIRRLGLLVRMQQIDHRLGKRTFGEKHSDKGRVSTGVQRLSLLELNPGKPERIDKIQFDPVFTEKLEQARRKRLIGVLGVDNFFRIVLSVIGEKNGAIHLGVFRQIVNTGDNGS